MFIICITSILLFPVLLIQCRTKENKRRVAQTPTPRARSRGGSKWRRTRKPRPTTVKEEEVSSLVFYEIEVSTEPAFYSEVVHWICKNAIRQRHPEKRPSTEELSEEECYQGMRRADSEAGSRLSGHPERREHCTAARDTIQYQNRPEAAKERGILGRSERGWHSFVCQEYWIKRTFIEREFMLSLGYCRCLMFSHQFYHCLFPPPRLLSHLYQTLSDCQRLFP